MRLRGISKRRKEMGEKAWAEYQKQKTKNKSKKRNKGFIGQDIESYVYYKRNQKLKLVEYKGGKCKKCGYDKNKNILQFHHLDPTKKDFSISKRSLSFENAKKEANKCILICPTCHSEIHDAEYVKSKEQTVKRMKKNRQVARVVMDRTANPGS